MACNAAHGAQGRVCIEQAASLSSSALYLDFVREGVEQVQTHVNSDGIRNTRSLHTNRNRAQATFVRGPIVCHPSPLDLDTLLPLILGAAESTDTFALAETIPDCIIGKDLDGVLYDYAESKVNRAVFSSQAGGLLELRMDFLGVAQASLGAWPSITLGTTLADQPLVHSDSTTALNLDGNAIAMMNWRMTIENGLDLRFTNSLTPTSICPHWRKITVEFTIPYFSANEKALYTTGISAIAGDVTFTNSAVSTKFDWAALHLEARTPVIRGKKEIAQHLKYSALETASAKELVVTNDSAV